MKYICIFPVVLMLLLTRSKLLAQPPFNNSELDIGMRIPGMENYRGKLLILDFWNVNCLSCIAAFPEMQALQDRFGDRIQVLLVTTDPAEKVEQLKERSIIVKQIKLPMIVGDSTLFRRFPFVSLPAHVWVGPDGIILQMTNGQNTTVEGVLNFLWGKDPMLPVKREQKDYDLSQSLMVAGNGRQTGSMFYYSCLAGRMPTDLQQAGVLAEPDGTKTIIRAINTSILDLYQLAYGESATGVFRNENRIKLRFKDPSRIRWPKEVSKQDDWKIQNTYSYELKVQPVLAGRLFDLMKKDLDQLFDINSHLEKQTVPCWILVRTGGTDRMHTTGGEWRYRPNKDLGNGVKAEIHNLPMAKLVALLETITYHLGPDVPPILDETAYKGNLDIRLNNYPDSLALLRKELIKYGLDLVEEKRSIDILVLEDAH